MSTSTDVRAKYIRKLKKKRLAYERKFSELSRKEQSAGDKFFVRILYIYIFARRAIPILFITPLLLAHLLYQSYKLSYFLEVAPPITFYTFESLALILVVVVLYAFIVESAYTKMEVYVGPTLAFSNVDIRKENMAREYRFVIKELEKYNELERPPMERLMKYKL